MLGTNNRLLNFSLIQDLMLFEYSIQGNFVYPFLTLLSPHEEESPLSRAEGSSSQSPSLLLLWILSLDLSSYLWTSWALLAWKLRKENQSMILCRNLALWLLLGKSSRCIFRRSWKRRWLQLWKWWWKWSRQLTPDIAHKPKDPK